MKCPKCKRSRLSRLRTYDKGDHVYRENKCSNKKCDFRVSTLEYTKEMFDKLHTDARQSVYEAARKQEAAEMESHALTEALKRLFEPVLKEMRPIPKPERYKKPKRRSAHL